MKIVKITIPIYHGYLRIVIAKDFIKAAKKLKIDDDGNDLSRFGSFVCTSNDNIGHSHYNIFLHKNINHDLLAHEVVHLVNAIYVERKIKLDPYNDEPQAYLTGWITGQIYNTLNKKNGRK